MGVVLHKKMLRDLLERKGANAGIILLMAIGIMVFTSFSMLERNMVQSTEHFYETAHLSDAFLEMKAIPRGNLEAAVRIPGVDRVQGRIRMEAKVAFPGSGEAVYLRINSMDNPLTDLNRFVLTKGSYPAPAKNQILLDQLFAATNDLDVGSVMTLTVMGQEWSYTVSGFGASPEYVYALRDEGDLFPDYKSFGVAMIPLEDLEAMSNLVGQYNSALFTLEKGWTLEEVKAAVEENLKPYGASGVLGREEQVSWMMVDQELGSLKVFGKIFPLIFLGIAALVEFIMLERLVASQRTQIGILKAYGYTKKEILQHFVRYALILGILGAVLGSILGILIFYPLLNMYRVFFNFPQIYGGLSPENFAYGILLSLVFSYGAGRKGAHYAATLNPVEAMLPQVPSYQGKGALPAWALSCFETWGRMALRNIGRNKKRSLFLVIGITMTCALGILSMVMMTMMDTMIYDRYRHSERYDAKLTFRQPMEGFGALMELRGKRGVTQGEALLEAPVILHHQFLKKRLLVTGIQANSDLYRIVDDKKVRIPLTGNGIILSKRVAQLLQAQIGDQLLLESPYGNFAQKRAVFVEGIVDQSVGIGAYMEKTSLEKLLGQRDMATSLIFKTQDLSYVKSIREDYRESPKVAAVMAMEETIQKVKELMASYGSMVYIYAVLGFLIGFVVIYNSYLVTVNERSRELASLMVLGMSRREVGRIIALEQWLLAMVGMLLGWPTSMLMLRGVKSQIDNDFFSLPIGITLPGLLLGFGCTLFSVWVAQIRGKKKIKELSIVDVLKGRE